MGQHPAAVWHGWQSPAQLPERAWGLWSGGDPKLWGGLCDSGPYVQMAAAGEHGEWAHPARTRPAAGGSTWYRCVDMEFPLMDLHPHWCGGEQDDPISAVSGGCVDQPLV